MLFKRCFGIYGEMHINQNLECFITPAMIII